jgi:hypothetical protein
MATLTPAELAAFANPISNDDELPELETSEDMQEGGPGRFGLLITLLEAHAEDVQALSDEFDPDQLTDVGQELDEDEQESLREGAQQLPEELQAELAKALPGVTIDEAREIAEHLETEEIIDDAERLAGWLYRLGEVGLEGGEAEEPDEEEDEETDVEELDFGDE